MDTHNPNEHALVTRVPMPIVETIDTLAEICGLSRSQFTAFLIQEALDAVRRNIIKTPDPKPAPRPRRIRLHRKRPLQVNHIVQPMIDAYPSMSPPPAAAAPVIHHPTPVAHPDTVATSAVGEC